ncbi:tetratricopeptide repeat protein [Rhodobacteraceae bacterium NNCM2]|nr:tetratricopeptide repeat protein [Coraliihabitans acroporae]
MTEMTTISASRLLETAIAHHRKDEIEAAAPLYRAYLARVPGNAQAWTNYGALLRKQGHYRAAIAAHKRSLALAPDFDNAKNNLANAFNDAGDYEPAIRIREELLAKEPDSPAALRDLAVSLRGDWQHERVIELIDAAEARMDISDEGELLLQRGLSHLMLGHYRRGFADFEGRYGGNEVSLPEGVPFPRWEGQEIAGKRLLIIPEQGFGDAILMARFLPALIKMGAEVSMIVKEPLHRLLEPLVDGYDGKLRIVSHARKSDPFDFYTPNMSLPLLVGFSEDSPVPPPPKLHIPEASRTRARALLKPYDDCFKIGVVWTGSLTYKANHRRSSGPEYFLGLAEMPGVQLFSLYKGEAHEAFLNSGMAGLIMDACGNDHDFADTAAIIDEMDLMITTDTAVVHVAGSLGKPVWNLLAHEGFWLYGSGETTPWYPEMRLFRQKTNGDWAELFGRVEAELRNHLRKRA